MLSMWPALAAVGDSLDLLWPSPLLKLVDPIAQGVNKELMQLIFQLAQSGRGVQKTNLGGWQSDVDLFERTEPAIATVRTRAYHAVFRYLQSMAPRGSKGKFEVSIGSAWANVNNQSHGNSPHLHPSVQVAGIYYVDDGGNRDGGVRFIDPRPQASMVHVPARWMTGMGEHIKMQAVPGLFVLFPAWLQHYVIAHQGSRPRVSISFNVRLTFPDDSDDAADGYIGSSTADTAASPPALSFVVPPHHQRDFLDAAVARDMRVS